ncbi:hypothetical protein K435DRAFT_807044 [Dendrothele bispora CBS 962.96]|uniref:Uncharacterized protein n=1 Tax=Dendrothele bispora (strain CBS 962.96) TaxID=1314807 RepID=A0A4S8L6D4_DENBC|nr:hypothetical protein K435DRAFT_807044 [Dendrothele bispora CBS 962.96]
MEYYQVLVELEQAEVVHELICELLVQVFCKYWLSEVDTLTLQILASSEKLRPIGGTPQKQGRTSRTIQLLEQKLHIPVRWKPGCDEWDKAKLMVQHQHYRKVEVLKLQVEKTYGKGSAGPLANYNDAAAALDPPTCQLDWESVMECYLLQKEEEIAKANRDLAHQIRIYRPCRGRFNEVHWKRLQETVDLAGFSGTLKPGIGKLSLKHSSKDNHPSDTKQTEHEGSGDKGDIDSNKEEADKDYEDLEGIIQISHD